MEALVIAALVAVALLVLGLLSDKVKGFSDPNSMTDQEILSAIAGQADWLEKQMLHVAKYGGQEPHPELATRRREYIFQLCETLVTRHPEPINLMYNATKRARQLEAEGVSHKTAVVQGVKQRLFQENGYTYLARWHPES